MRCFVTGASGFIGANLVHELVARGHEVTALFRPGSEAKTLETLPLRRVRGQITDRAMMKDAMKGVDWCFHVAGSYHLWLRNYDSMYTTNVDGTRIVLETATGVGCTRIVHTSTVGCIGAPEAGLSRNPPAPMRNGGAPAYPSNETVHLPAAQLNNHYKRSKLQAEQIALQLAAQGAPIIIVNPTAPFGPRDAKPTPTGQVLVDFLNRRLPAFIDTGLNWVHVRDVAVGHILAAEKGRLGERYILGNANGNWTLKQAFAVLEKISGIPAPQTQLPYPLAYGVAWVNELVAAATGGPPRAPLAGVRMARHKMFYDPSKAIRELGLPQTPPEQALADAVHWFRSHGYAP